MSFFERKNCPSWSQVWTGVFALLLAAGSVYGLLVANNGSTPAQNNKVASENKKGHINQGSNGSEKGWAGNTASTSVSQDVYTNFVLYPDVMISERRHGGREYQLSAGVANTISDQEDWRQKLQEGPPDESYYNFVKVYEDGAEESIPVSVSYCPQYTDVCTNTTRNLGSVTNGSASLNSSPIEMSASVQRVEFTAGGDVVDAMERPQSPLQIASFTVDEQAGANLGNQKSNPDTKRRIHISVTPSETDNINGSLRYLQRSDQWELATIYKRDNATSTVDFDYQVTPENIRSQFENVDFKAEFTDGFYLVQAEKDNFIEVKKQPPEFDLSLVREIHFTPQQSKPQAYLRAPFVIKAHDFRDPILGRSDTIPNKYEINWESRSLPLNNIASSTRSQYYTGLKVDIPKEREFNSLTGEHKVTLALEDKEGGRSAQKTVTFDLVSLPEACTAKEKTILSPRRGCPRTQQAE